MGGATTGAGGADTDAAGGALTCTAQSIAPGSTGTMRSMLRPSALQVTL